MDETDDQPGCGAALTAIGTIIINFMTGIILVPSTFHFQGSAYDTDGLNYFQTEGFPEVQEVSVSVIFVPKLQKEEILLLLKMATKLK